MFTTLIEWHRLWFPQDKPRPIVIVQVLCGPCTAESERMQAVIRSADDRTEFNARRRG